MVLDHITSRTSSLNRRSFIKNSAFALGSLAGGNALLTACNSGNSGNAAPTVLNVMFNEASSLISKAQLQAFQHANNCTVKITTFDQLRLNASLQAGSPPDIVRTEGASEMPNLIARGLCENLDPYFAKSTVLKPSDFDPVVKATYAFDGKKQGQGPVYGFPLAYSQDATLWYNKKLFDQAGVPYLSETDPVSYDQLLAAAKKLTVRSGNKVQTYGFDPSWGFLNQPHLAQMIAQQGASLWNEDFTKADFTQPAARKAIQWYIDWAQAYVGTSPLDPPQSGWAGPLYNAERIAVISYGYWFNTWISGYESQEDTHGLIDRSSFAPAPQMGPTRVDSSMAGTGGWVPVKSKNKDLAFKFMEFFFGGEPSIGYFKSGGGLPGLKSQRTLLPKTTATDRQHYEDQQRNLQYFSALRFSPYANKAAMESAISTVLQTAMKGQVSTDTAITLLQSQVDAVVQQGRDQIGG